MEMNESDALVSDEKIDFTAAQLNDIASVILSSLTDDGQIEFETGIQMKLFFNTIIDMAINHKDECQEILDEVGSDEDFDIVKAAQEFSSEVKYES